MRYFTSSMNNATHFFRRHLFEWAAANPRPMPWKGEKDPYKIWLSEIILQQTRVEQGWPYFEKFVAHYPHVRALADAPEDDVLKLWEGLGYYTRARNLHAAAKHIAYELGGIFPNTFDALLALRGVGDYTAAAIASFAYNLPHAVLDGNVYRVLARYFAIETPTDLPVAKKQFSALAHEMLDPVHPAAFNQAMMDFGATCCTPSQPGCGGCPLRPECAAACSNRVGEFPVRIKKMEKKKRFFMYVVIRHGEQTWLRKRASNDIWRGLYEFPMLEVAQLAELHTRSIEQVLWPDGLPRAAKWGNTSEYYRHILTHQDIEAAFIELHLPLGTDPAFFRLPWLEGSFEVPYLEAKKKFAFPRLIVRFFDKNV